MQEFDMKVMHHISCNGSPSLSKALKSFQVEFTEGFLPTQNQEQVSFLAFDIGEADENYPIILTISLLTIWIFVTRSILRKIYYNQNG